MSNQNLLPYLHISFTIYNIDICKQGNNLIHRSYIMPIMDHRKWALILSSDTSFSITYSPSLYLSLSLSLSLSRSLFSSLPHRTAENRILEQDIMTASTVVYVVVTSIIDKPMLTFQCIK